MTLVVLSFAACAPKAPQQGAEANVPVIVLPTLSGQTYNLTAAMQERPVIIASMAGYCGYCKAQAPLLDKLAGEYEGKNVDFVFAFVDQTPDGLQETIKSLGIEHANVVYNGGEFAQAAGVEGFPATFLIYKGEIMEDWGGYSPDHIDAIRARLAGMVK